MERIPRRREPLRVGAGARQDLAQVVRESALLPPVAWIPERYFVIPHAVSPQRRAQVKVAGDDDARAISARPAFSGRRAAPDRKARNTRRPREVGAKRPVIEEHRERLFGQRFEPRLAGGEALLALRAS